MYPTAPIDYLNPNLPPGLRSVVMPVIEATPECSSATGAATSFTAATMALPGDEVTPERFVCFQFDGWQGLYIHPNIWHEGVFALSGTQRFFDRQGAVHARVTVDFAREFGCLLEAPIPRAR